MLLTMTPSLCHGEAVWIGLWGIKIGTPSMQAEYELIPKERGLYECIFIEPDIAVWMFD